MKHLILPLALTCALTAQLSAQSIVGSWSIKNAGNSKSDAVVTFLANGTYTMAADGNPNREPSGKDGMERGTYKWNPDTHAISIKTLVDTTGKWGFSDTKLKTASVTATKLILSDNSGSFSLKRVTGKSSLVGGWYTKSGSGYAVATFLSDGSYFMVRDGESDGGRTGMERGTYTWNPTTKVFTRNVINDTNKSWGFSDKAERFFAVKKNILTMTIKGEDSYMLSRVIDL